MTLHMDALHNLDEALDVRGALNQSDISIQ